MYAKVFRQIFDSSIANDYRLRHFFTDLLTLAEIDGVVDMTPEAISARTRIPLEQVIKHLHSLEQPDPRSRSEMHEGKRIVRLDDHRDWGWQIVNYSAYREIASEEQRRERTKNRTRKWRNKKTLQNGDAPVTHGDAGDAMQRQKQGEMQKEKEREEEIALPPNFPKSPDDAIKQCEGTYCMESAFITKLYNSAMSKNGKDGNGQPIMSFRHYVAKHWPSEVSRREEKKINGADKIIHNQEYSRILFAIKDIKNSYGDHQDMSKKDRETLTGLVARKNELKSLLGLHI